MFWLRNKKGNYSKSVISCYLKEDRKLVFKTDYRLMRSSVLQNAPAMHLTCIKLPSVFVLSILCGFIRQILLYYLEARQKLLLVKFRTAGYD